MSDSFVPQLNLTQKSRMGTQIMVTLFVVLAAVYGYYNVEPVMEYYRVDPSGLKDIPAWAIFVMVGLSLIPAIFVFFLLKKDFNFVPDKLMDV